MNKQTITEALAHLKTAEIAAAQNFALARAKLKEAIGDQDGDGDVDLKDAQLKVSKAVGGWTLRDTKIATGFLLAGYVVAKVLPFILKLV